MQTGHVTSLRLTPIRSERAAAVLQDDMEVMGPVRLARVEEARSRIVTAIRRLEEAEEIFVMRGGGEELIV